MARFGEIARIEARGKKVRVTLKSGTALDLDRFEASDFDDGVRVWDGRRGVVDLDSLRIRTIELLPTAGLGAVPHRLHGTVRTRQGDFTGFVQWDRQECVGTDELVGHTAEGALRLRFDTLRSIARQSRDSSRVTLDAPSRGVDYSIPFSLIASIAPPKVTLRSGEELHLERAGDLGEENAGMLIFVDGRQRPEYVPWTDVERVDLAPPPSGSEA